MGIKGLYAFLRQQAPASFRERTLKSFMGRKVAVDASMSLYAFLAAIRTGESALTNEAGEETSHIAGMFSRVVRLLENGITPILVFDGAAPEEKRAELDARREAKNVAVRDLEAAKERGDTEAAIRLAKRTIQVTPKHNQDVITLLSYLGVEYVEAPGEAEAQCVVMAKEGLVYGVATEDADALTFGCPILLRGVVASEAKQKLYPPVEIDLETVLHQLEFSMAQFVDFCILCGCDYAKTIKGVGPGTAFKMISEHKDIEGVISNLDVEKHPVPESGFEFGAARKLFADPLAYREEELKITKKSPDIKGLREWLIGHQFCPARVENMVLRFRKISTGPKQTRLDTFFMKATKKLAPPPDRKGGRRTSLKASSKKIGKK